MALQRSIRRRLTGLVLTREEKAVRHTEVEQIFERISRAETKCLLDKRNSLSGAVDGRQGNPA